MGALSSEMMKIEGCEVGRVVANIAVGEGGGAEEGGRGHEGAVEPPQGGGGFGHGGGVHVQTGVLLLPFCTPVLEPYFHLQISNYIYERNSIMFV